MSELEPMIKDVMKRLDSNPIARCGIEAHLKNSNHIFPTDMVTSIGASKPQKELVQKLIDDYGEYLVSKIFSEIFHKQNKDWRDGLE